MNSFAITLSGVSKAYGSLQAVDHLDLNIPAGSVYGFLGPNGSGKTSTLRMVMNIIIPDEGAIQVLDRPAGPETRNFIGYLPEERGLYPKMKVGDLLRFFAELKRVPADAARSRVKTWLERVELSGWENKKINELSKGMQQKIQFIVSVISDPPILILDEPSSGLDPVNANLLKEILLQLRSEGKTILFSTHRMEEAERLCDHICLIDHGRKVLDGKLKEIRASAGKNAIRLEFAGDGKILANAPGVLSVDDYGNYAELRLRPGANPAEILRFLSPRLEITKFELMEPTLNQIFLERVGNRNGSPNAEAAYHREAGISTAS